MDFCTFHRALLGKDQSQTPAHWRLRSDHERLYKAFEAQNKCGYDSESKDPLRFIATAVLALGQTDQGKVSVMIFAPHNCHGFIKENLKALTRYCFRARKGQNSEVLREAFNRLLLSSDYAGQPFPSGPWVSFGLTSTDPSVPDWIKRCLL